MSKPDGNSDELFAYFGFGSLVNRNTLSSDIIDAVPVTLRGWRRHWQSRPHEPMQNRDVKSIALLSVHRDAQCDIDGLLIIDRMKNLPDLDLRESHYRKQVLAYDDFVSPDSLLNGFQDIPVHVYVSPAEYRNDNDITLLRSYIDVVMQGFLNEYGADGLKHFVDTTAGFDLPVHEDRHNPVYPRHQKISPANVQLFDKILHGHTGVKSMGVYNRIFNGFE